MKSRGLVDPVVALAEMVGAGLRLTLCEMPKPRSCTLYKHGAGDRATHWVSFDYTNRW